MRLMEGPFELNPPKKSIEPSPKTAWFIMFQEIIQATINPIQPNSTQFNPSIPLETTPELHDGPPHTVTLKPSTAEAISPLQSAKTSSCELCLGYMAMLGQEGVETMDFGDGVEPTNWDQLGRPRVI
jgi:hypothetical protein